MDSATLIKGLKSGKLVRIKYSDKNEDWLDPAHWWSEELWRYDAETGYVNISYPVSSYEEGHFSSHDLEEAEGELREAVWGMSEDGDAWVASITVEDGDTAS